MYKLLILSFFLLATSAEASKYVVLVTSGKNEKWVEKHIESVFSQDFDDFRVVWMDDASSDRTSQILKESLKKHTRGAVVTYVRNEVKTCMAHCTYQAIHNYINDDEIIIFLDGDDWFIHDKVISRMDRFYTENPYTWMTTSRLKRLANGAIIPRYGEPMIFSFTAIDNNNLRKKYSTKFFKCNALRTCRAWLYKLIDKQYLMMNGEFVPTSGDISYLYPMFCMAGKHYRFVDEVLYLHNNHPNNDEVAKFEEQAASCKYFLSRKPYKPLRHTPFERCKRRGCRVCKKYRVQERV